MSWIAWTKQHGTAAFITAFSALSSFVTLFIDVNSSVSVKWVLAATLAALWIAAIAGLAITSSAKSMTSDFNSTVIGVREQGEVLVVRSIAPVNMNTVVSLWEDQDGLEKFAGIGVVENVQDNGISSIRVLKPAVKFDSKKKFIVKLALPIQHVQAMP